MNTITLYRKNGSWIASFDGPHAYEIICRMAATDIVTAFRDTMDAGRVAEEIGRLNPGVTIVVEDKRRAELLAAVQASNRELKGFVFRRDL